MLYTLFFSLYIFLISGSFILVLKYNKLYSDEESILRKAEKRMLRMMCGVQLAVGVSTKELMASLDLISTIVEVVRQGSLRWLGHVVRKGDDCVKQAWRFKGEGSRGRRRPRLAWKGMLENLCHGLGSDFEDAYDTVK